ncbi:MAG: hypothetical protein ACYC26_01105 [Phycisphaerales bacterium]
MDKTSSASAVVYWVASDGGHMTRSRLRLSKRRFTLPTAAFLTPHSSLLTPRYSLLATRFSKPQAVGLKPR